MYNIGDRVGAIQKTDDSTVFLYGYGTYLGIHVPPENIGFGIPNPKIALDDGQIVYGLQCWWGTEERVQKMIGDRKVVMVKVAENE